MAKLKKVKIQNRHEKEDRITKRGMRLRIDESDGQVLGDLILTNRYVYFCPRSAQRTDGVKISWDKVIKFLEIIEKPSDLS